MKSIWLTTGLVGFWLFGANVQAHDIQANEGYLSTPEGTVVRTGFGECWRTSAWTPALAIPDCEGGRFEQDGASAGKTSPPAEPQRDATAKAAGTATAAPTRPATTTAAVARPGPAVPSTAPAKAPAWQSVNLSGSALFASGQASLQSEGMHALDRLAETMRRYPQVERIEVLGHTDDRGRAASNLRLSERRAEAVRDYLLARGVQAERISTRGMGASEPIAGNDTAEGRASNRRVEIKVFAQQRVE